MKKKTAITGFGEMVKNSDGSVSRQTPPIKDTKTFNVASLVVNQLEKNQDGTLDIYSLFKAQDANNAIAQDVRTSGMARQDVLCYMFWADYFSDNLVYAVEEIIRFSPLRNEYKRTMKTSLKRVVSVLSDGLQEMVITDNTDGLEIEIVDLTIESPVQKLTRQLGEALAKDAYATGNDVNLDIIADGIKISMEKQADKLNKKTAKGLSKTSKKAGKAMAKMIFEDEQRENKTAEIARLSGVEVRKTA